MTNRWANSAAKPDPLRSTIFWSLLMVSLTTTAFWSAVHGGFLWDDDAHLTANPYVVGPLGLRGIWTSSAATYYPLVLTNFWLQYKLWALDPLPYHVVNIALHTACAFLLWRLLQQLKVRGAWLGATLWAVHPVQVESVAWITELKNTQSCLFYLLSAWFFVKWLEGTSSPKRGHRSYLLSLAFAAFAILSKTSTVMLPVVLVMVWWWREERWRYRNALWLVPHFILSVAAGLWTIWEQKFHSGAVGPEWMLSFPERLALAGKIAWFYLVKLLWPQPLVFIYPRWPVEVHALSFVPLASIAILMVMLWRYRNTILRAPFVAFTYFLISIFPVSGLFDIYFFRYSFVGDHFQYLAAMGPLALVGAGIALLFEPAAGRKRLLIPALSAGLLFLLGNLTSRQTRVYAGPLTLWRDTLAKNPDAWVAHTNLGAELDDQNRFSEAILEYQQALRINPRDSEASNNLATDLARTGHVDDGIKQWEEGLRIQPNHAPSHNNLGIVLAQRNRLPEALEHWRKATQIDPNYVDAHYNLAMALSDDGQFDEAAEQYRQVLRLKPDDAEAKYALTLALKHQK